MKIILSNWKEFDVGSFAKRNYNKSAQQLLQNILLPLFEGAFFFER